MFESLAGSPRTGKKRGVGDGEREEENKNEKNTFANPWY